MPKSENEKFIQGTWFLAGETPEENGPGHAWFLEWEFNNGKFVQKGYPPILQEGNYDVMEDEENRLKLRLKKQKGTFGTKDSELELVIDREARTLSIDGKNGFRPQIKNKTE